MKRIIALINRLRQLSNITIYLLKNLRVNIGIEHKSYCSESIKIIYLTIRNKIQNKNYITIKINEKGDCRVIIERGLVIDSEVVIINTNKMKDSEINRLIEETISTNNDEMFFPLDNMYKLDKDNIDNNSCLK